MTSVVKCCAEKAVVTFFILDARQIQKRWFKYQNTILGQIISICSLYFYMVNACLFKYSDTLSLLVIK